jgi:hypothetical protein
MGNYHVPFWRAVEGATSSLTLIGGSGLACRVKTGDVRYFQHSLFGEDLGLLKTPPSSNRPQVC